MVIGKAKEICIVSLISEKKKYPQYILAVTNANCFESSPQKIKFWFITIIRIMFELQIKNDVTPNSNATMGSVNWVTSFR